MCYYVLFALTCLRTRGFYLIFSSRGRGGGGGGGGGRGGYHDGGRGGGGGYRDGGREWDDARGAYVRSDHSDGRREDRGGPPRGYVTSFFAHVSDSVIVNSTVQL
jgi:hypothetical protein